MRHRRLGILSCDGVLRLGIGSALPRLTYAAVGGRGGDLNSKEIVKGNRTGAPRSPERTPDFLWRLMALANFMRLSLMKAAHADVGGAPCRKSGYVGRKRWAQPNDRFYSTDMGIRNTLTRTKGTCPIPSDPCHSSVATGRTLFRSSLSGSKQKELASSLSVSYCVPERPLSSHSPGQRIQ